MNPSNPGFRSTALRCFALAAAVLVLAAFASPAEASTCTYDFTFSYTGSGDVRVEVDVDCGPYSVYQTRLSVSPGFNSTTWYGSYARIDVADSSGLQLYCANATATYWQGMFLALDEGGSECAYM